MRSTLFTKATLLAVILGFFAATTSEAAFSVTITAAGGSSGTVTIVDNGSGDSNSSTNAITYIGTVGGYTLVVNVTQDAPTGINGVGTLNINVISTRSSAVTGTLTIQGVSDAYTFLNGPPGNGSNILSVSSFAGSTLSGTTVYDDGNNPVTTSPTVTVNNGTGGQSFFTTGPTIGTFTLTGTLVITNQGAGNVNATLTSTLSAVPVPPAFALLASAVPFGLLALRKRRK